METTNRGFPILRFADVDGAACSIQDSSIMEHDCIWLGRDGIEDARMHLTRSMAAEILPTLQPVDMEAIHFDDLYGSRCIISRSKDDPGNLRMGVTLDFEGGARSPMRLSHKEVALLRPLLYRFVETGSIGE